MSSPPFVVSSRAPAVDLGAGYRGAPPKAVSVMSDNTAEGFDLETPEGEQSRSVDPSEDATR